MTSTERNRSFFNWPFYAKYPFGTIRGDIVAPRIQLCNRIMVYPGKVLHKNASKLEEKVLYHSQENDAYL